MQELASELESIEQRLDAGSYQPGPWLRFVRSLSESDADVRRRLAADVDRISDKLHARRQPQRFRFERALAAEHLAALIAMVGLALGVSRASPVLVLLSALLLAAALQPITKVLTGLMLGMGFSYAYLIYGEPRFKLRYGRYLAAPRWKRTVYHLAGIVGAPLAWWIASEASRDATPRTAEALWLLCLAHLIYQLVILALAALGMRRMWPYGALRLTSPGAAGDELRAAFLSRPAHDLEISP